MQIVRILLWFDWLYCFSHAFSFLSVLFLWMFLTFTRYSLVSFSENFWSFLAHVADFVVELNSSWVFLTRTFIEHILSETSLYIERGSVLLYTGERNFFVIRYATKVNIELFANISWHLQNSHFWGCYAPLRAYFGGFSLRDGSCEIPKNRCFHRLRNYYYFWILFSKQIFIGVFLQPRESRSVQKARRYLFLWKIFTKNEIFLNFLLTESFSVYSMRLVRFRTKSSWCINGCLLKSCLNSLEIPSRMEIRLQRFPSKGWKSIPSSSNNVSECQQRDCNNDSFETLFWHNSGPTPKTGFMGMNVMCSILKSLCLRFKAKIDYGVFFKPLYFDSIRAPGLLIRPQMITERRILRRDFEIWSYDMVRPDSKLENFNFFWRLVTYHWACLTPPFWHLRASWRHFEIFVETEKSWILKNFTKGSATPSRVSILRRRCFSTRLLPPSRVLQCHFLSCCASTSTYDTRKQNLVELSRNPYQ